MKFILISLFMHSFLLGDISPIIYNEEERDIKLKENEKAILKPGADISKVTMTDTTEMIIDGDVKITHMYIEKKSKVQIKNLSAISYLTLFDESELFISKTSSGTVFNLDLYDNSHISINGIKLSFLNLYDSSEANITKLVFNGERFSLGDINIRGGAIVFMENSIINLYADNVKFNNGKLTGYWKDGSKFSFSLIKNISKKPIKTRKVNVKTPVARAMIRLGQHGVNEQYSAPTSMPSQIIVHKAIESKY